MRKRKLIEQVIVAAQGGEPEDFEQWKAGMISAVRVNFGAGSPQLTDIANISFRNSLDPSADDEKAKRRIDARFRSINTAVAKLEGFLTELPERDEAELHLSLCKVQELSDDGHVNAAASKAASIVESELRNALDGDDSTLSALGGKAFNPGSPLLVPSMLVKDSKPYNNWLNSSMYSVHMLAALRNSPAHGDELSQVECRAMITVADMLLHRLDEV